MKGWRYQDGAEIELTSLQADIVAMLIGNKPPDESLVRFFAMGRCAGRSTVLYTADQYDRFSRDAGRPR